jgi:cytochrome c oxidase subunit 4
MSEQAAAPATPLGMKAWLMGPAKKYVAIFAWLAVLTVVEIVASQLPLAKRAVAVILIATALIKASLVALYFMHLRHETKLIISMVVIPTLIAILFLVGIFPDIVLIPRSLR